MAPMYGDVHNLKPADASVNQDKSNKDFDNGGTQHPEATGCYYTSSTWEPRDEVKGDIARIIFYMDTRYEGTNGEIDLTVVDEINTYPLPEHGKLSTLLEWNLQDPPDEFERNRNNVIFSWQKNRNPFIDHPEFAELIWGDQILTTISFDDFAIFPAAPVQGENIDVEVEVTSSQGPLSEVKLFWGLSYENTENEIMMTSSGGDIYQAQSPQQGGATTVYYRVEATDAAGTDSSIVYNFYVAPIFSGTLTSIYDVQGQQPVSPYIDQIVSVTGVVTANFGEEYFLQDGTGPWNGLFIYDPGRNPSIGDSLIITGTIEEYFEKTEMKEVSGYYHISSNNELPEPVVINTGDAGEQYESVLIRVINAICTDDEYHSNFYMWKVNDGSGEMLVHNTSIFEFEPELGETYNVTGPLNYDFDEWKIELRFEDDVQAGTDVFPPELEDIEPINDNLIKLTFSEVLDVATATATDNYSLNNDVEITGAEMHGFLNNVVYLDVTEMNTGNYTLDINGVADPAGNTMENFQAEFYYESTGIYDPGQASVFNVYPNPTGGHCTVTYLSDFAGTVGLNLYDLAGRVLMTETISVVPGENTINLDIDLRKGVYLIGVEREHSGKMQKLIIR